jgi:DNA-binding GntR family transcriptional regulator
MKLFKSIQNKDITLAQKTYLTLKRNIIEGYILPGSVLSDIKIREIFKISRTVSREVLIKLAKENLVTTIPQKGTYVSKINLKEVSNYLFIRKTVEDKILNLAIEHASSHFLKKLFENLMQQEYLLKCENTSFELIKIDNNFHELIYESVDKEYVWKMLEPYQVQYDRLRIIALKGNYTQDIMYKHHLEMYNIIFKKIEGSTIEVLKSHLGNFKNLYNEVINNNLEYFTEIDLFMNKSELN